MPDLVTELAARGRSLPPAERVRLLDLLLESLHESMATQAEASWDKEIERRVARYESGQAELHDVADVMVEAARIAP